MILQRLIGLLCNCVYVCVCVLEQNRVMETIVGILARAVVACFVFSVRLDVHNLKQIIVLNLLGGFPLWIEF